MFLISYEIYSHTKYHSDRWGCLRTIPVSLHTTYTLPFCWPFSKAHHCVFDFFKKCFSFHSGNQWFHSFQYVMKFNLERLETCLSQAVQHSVYHAPDYCQSYCKTKWCCSKNGHQKCKVCMICSKLGKKCRNTNDPLVT